MTIRSPTQRVCSFSLLRQADQLIGLSLCQQVELSFLQVQWTQGCSYSTLPSFSITERSVPLT